MIFFVKLSAFSVFIEIFVSEYVLENVVFIRNSRKIFADIINFC